MPLRRPLVLATVYRFPDTSMARLADYGPLIELWERHLRGPGRFEGDIALLTNAPELATGSVMALPFERECKDVKDFFLQRVLQLESMNLAKYTHVLHLDLDILAVNDISPLLPDEEGIFGSTSLMKMLHKRHAGYRMGRISRLLSSLTTKRGREPGLNCCSIGFRVSDERPALRSWCDVIREYGFDEPRPPLDDQTLLNLAGWLGRTTTRRYPPTWVQHRDWRRTDDAILWHFPTPDRLRVMREHALV